MHGIIPPLPTNINELKTQIFVAIFKWFERILKSG